MTFTDEQIHSGVGLPSKSHRMAIEIPSGLPTSPEEIEMSVDMAGERSLWAFYKQYGEAPQSVQQFDFIHDGARHIGVLCFTNEP